MIDLRETPDGVRLRVFAVPRSGRGAIERVNEGELRVRVAAAPVDGAANRHLIDFLADVLALPSRKVELTSGAHGRHKTVLIRGLSAGEVERRLRATLSAMSAGAARGG